jgi:hypothetical protein
MKQVKFLMTLPLVLSLGVISGCSDDTASGTDVSGANTNSGSLGDSTPTGKIDAAGFYVLYDPAIPTVFDSDLSYQQQQVTVTVFAEDVNDLTELSGQTVNFKTEWGGWLDERDSCVLDKGQCSVTWRSGAPSTAPQDCRVAITAWADGEESFFDANDNNLYDPTETFADMQEPFLSINSNVNDSFDAALSTFEGVGELIDIKDFDGRSGHNFAHDAGDGKYTGTLCAAANPNCSGRTSMIIHYRSTLLIQEIFTDSNDIDGDGDTTEEINFCNFASY